MSESIQRFAIFKREIIMLLIGLLAQWPIWWASVYASKISYDVWSEGRGHPCLPLLSQYSINLLPLIAPITIAVLLIAFGLGCMCRRPVISLMAMFITVVVEACLLAFFALGVILPGMHMIVKMSSSS